ncbi:MAG: glycosyltransferase [Nitrospirae bacterium]|nr:glycosyltransferase [Nitrospirota bacterium]
MTTDNYYTISVIEAKSGRPSMRMISGDGSSKAVHSIYDPEAEAKTIADAFSFDGIGILVILGLGLGYHLAALISRFPKAMIIVVESSHEIYELAMKHGRTGEIEDRVRFIVGLPSDEAIKEIARFQMKAGMPPLAFFPLLPAISALPGYYNPVLSSLKKTVSVRFWERLRYPKFKEEITKIALIDFGYFLTSELDKAIRRLGHKVSKVPVRKGENGEVIVSRLLSSILEFKPDMFLTVNHLGFDEDGVLTSFFKSIDMPVASWYVDSPNLIVRAFDRNVSPCVTLFLWDKGYISDMKDMGFELVEYLPLATDTDVFKPLELSQKDLNRFSSDIGFAGNSMVEPVADKLEKVPFELHAIVERLAQYKSVLRGSFDDSLRILNKDEQEKIKVLPVLERLDLEAAVLWRATLLYRLSCMEMFREYRPGIHGDKGWHELLSRDFSIRPPLNYYRELPLFYNACKINFNATNLQMGRAVNQRVFDVPACGAFLLTDDQDALRDLFDTGKEVITYKDKEEIPDLLKFYLKNPQERMRIAERGRERVVREHTYVHRIKMLTDSMKRRYS